MHLVCGKPLDMESATIAATRQVVDIPLPIMAAVTGHLQMRVKCSCGHCCKGRFPENVNAPISFGPNIMALASYHSTYQNVPFKRLTHLFETIFGLHVSEGTVSNMLNTMKRISKKPYEMIRRKVAAGKVAGADETGVNVSGKNSWLWAFQNKAATYLAFDKSRSRDVVNRNFSPEERRGTVRVTDRWPAYFMGDIGMEDHQVCIAHLLRNLTYTAQAFPDDAWSLDMLDLLRDSVHRRPRGKSGRGRGRIWRRGWTNCWRGRRSTRKRTGTAPNWTSSRKASPNTGTTSSPSSRTPPSRPRTTTARTPCGRPRPNSRSADASARNQARRTTPPSPPSYRRRSRTGRTPSRSSGSFRPLRWHSIIASIIIDRQGSRATGLWPWYLSSYIYILF